MQHLVSNFAAESAEASSGLGALGVDPKAFLIQLTTFVLAYLVLRKYAFGPILKVLKERRDTIESGVKLSEQMQKEKTELDAKVTKSLHEARVQADAIVADAHSAARDAIREAEEKASAKADAIIKEGKARGEQEVDRARKGLETELVSLISEATEVIIGEKVDAKKDAALVDRALKESRA